MRRRATADLVLRMFRVGLDTKQIADRLDTTEAKIMRLLVRAREEERDFNINTTIPTQHEPFVESGEK